MKVALLKRVRRRFSITYHPQGIPSNTKKPVVVFKDSENGFNNLQQEIVSSVLYVPDAVKIAHHIFLNRIIDILIAEGHGQARRKRAEKNIVKLFYK